MADEPTRDDHQTDTAPADAPQDAQTDASQTQDDLAGVPDEYKGKTPEELVKILQDKESFIKQRNEELGQVRAEKSELENQAAFNKQFGGGQPQSNQSQDPYGQPVLSGGETPQQEEPRSDEDFLTYGDLKKMNQQMQQRDFQARTQLQMAEPFLAQAKKEAPHLFKGLNDQEVKGVVQSYLSSGQLHPMNLSNPKTWKMAATYTQGEKTNYNFIPTPTVTNPDQPVETGIPSQNKPIVSEEEKIPITDDDRKFAREVLGKADITDDEIREFIKKGAESQKTGVS